jgi:threonine synthase
MTPLLLTQMDGLARPQIDASIRSLWRYRAAFPFPVDQPITLGEGCTPLIPGRVAGTDVLLKCEWFNPTCSFKDRGASVMLSLLRAQGVTSVLEDSSGNGGAAISAYAAAGGMAATIMAPASTSPAKTVQMRAHGATVELVPGTRQDTADAAVARSAEIFYASHNWHPFFLHGTKTLAYELWEDLGFRAPDNIITPCGAGSTVLGCEIGFSELFRSGQIDVMPRIFAAQPANCGPIAAAFLAGSDEPVATGISPTIAEGTAIAKPIRLREVLGTLRETRGGAVALSEAEIGQATLDLAKTGIYVEPTCAQAAAAFARLLETGTVTAEQTTVLIMTGTGLKATPLIARLLGVPL